MRLTSSHVRSGRHRPEQRRAGPRREEHEHEQAGDRVRRRGRAQRPGAEPRRGGEDRQQREADLQPGLLRQAHRSAGERRVARGAEQGDESTIADGGRCGRTRTRVVGASADGPAGVGGDVAAIGTGADASFRTSHAPPCTHARGAGRGPGRACGRSRRRLLRRLRRLPEGRAHRPVRALAERPARREGQDPERHRAVRAGLPAGARRGARGSRAQRVPDGRRPRRAADRRRPTTAAQAAPGADRDRPRSPRRRATVPSPPGSAQPVPAAADGAIVNAAARSADRGASEPPAPLIVAGGRSAACCCSACCCGAWRASSRGTRRGSRARGTPSRRPAGARAACGTTSPTGCGPVGAPPTTEGRPCGRPSGQTSCSSFGARRRRAARGGRRSAPDGAGPAPRSAARARRRDRPRGRPGRACGPCPRGCCRSAGR